MLTEADIYEALRACYDGSHLYQRPLNIVDLGLVESVSLAIDPDAPGAGIPGVPVKHRLALTLLAPSGNPDAQTQLRAQIANRLAGIQELSRTDIEFADEPAWTPARITPEGRRLLQLDASPFTIISNHVRKA
jgi:metal-sulfur cluster biosynthetic enzyme